MAAKWLLGLLAAVAVVASKGSGEDHPDPTEGPSMAPCHPPPYWTIEGENLMAKHRGNVTVVVLLQASCPICLWQASGFESLFNRYLEAGLWELSVVIINSRQPHSIQLLRELEKRVDRIPVYQESTEEPVWSILDGDKDDVFVYDRCGRLAYYVPLPLSFLNRPYVGAAILNAYFNDPCGVCDNVTSYDMEERINNITIASEVLETNETVLFDQDQTFTDEVSGNANRQTELFHGNKTHIGDDMVHHSHHGMHRHRHEPGYRNGSRRHHHHHHHHHNETESHHGNGTELVDEATQKPMAMQPHEHQHHLADTTLRNNRHEQQHHHEAKPHHHHAHHERKKHVNKHLQNDGNIVNEQPLKEHDVDKNISQTEASELQTKEIIQQQESLLTTTDIAILENATLPERRTSRRRNGRRNKEHNHSGRMGRERNRTSEGMESRPRRHYFQDPCSSITEDECKLGRRYFHIVRECCSLLPNNRIAIRVSPNCAAYNDIECAKIYRLRKCCYRTHHKEIKPSTNILPSPVSCNGFNQITCRLSQRLGFIHNECCPSYLYQLPTIDLIMPTDLMCQRINKEQCQQYQKNGLTHLCCSAAQLSEDSNMNCLQGLNKSCCYELPNCKDALEKCCKHVDGECLTSVRAACYRMAERKECNLALDSQTQNTSKAQLLSRIKNICQHEEHIAQLVTSCCNPSEYN